MRTVPGRREGQKGAHQTLPKDPMMFRMPNSSPPRDIIVIYEPPLLPEQSNT